ncbi:PP2C family serine/threonine-protein phosphatase [Actinomycetospora sp. TBRC 11914]|uniref:PP2C family protein-serine/threonine phosphatase n=1 Tax=Actinomycetospora sp. TBRC 11914 TaxID=2729387 RepID=UPI00145FB8AA|nr:protein phosphatase 2C domain-containing protein [Actinomycetospora sp. TBRC 11914]NMO92379.1 protein phosphatase [Actinomycetospora sp. TBRC 11914]
MSPGTTTTGGATCESCGERGEPGDRYCEGCGAELPATEGPPPAVREGTRARPVTARTAAPGTEPLPDGHLDSTDLEPGPGDTGDDDPGDDDPGDDPDGLGYDPADRDHAERFVPGAAAVTDVGLVRPANEDAFGLVRLPLAGTAHDLVVGVVCDGVGSVPGSEAASAVACATVLATARDAVAHPDPADPGLADTGGVDVTELAYACADAAVDAVSALGGPGRDSPACTYVAGMVVGDVLVVSWIGDSRAYWLVPDEPDASCVLTTDDSWAAEAVAVGLLEPEAAYADPRAHAITRWVAADGPPGPAHVVAHAADRPGVLLICSDGLWNHVPHPADLARLVRADGPPTTARAMLEAALSDGGTDNTTLVVVDVAPEGSPA